MKKYFIDPDIKKASTLPAEFYRSSDVFELEKEKVFLKCWHFTGDTGIVKVPGSVYPFTLMESYLDEPLLLTRDLNDNLHCLSNVCTHRGTILADSQGNLKTIQCRYHGRRFELNGKFKSMPEFEETENFPSEKDNLTKIPFDIWNNFIFVSPDPVKPLGDFVKVIEDRLEGVNKNRLVHEPSRSRDYLVKCNWALYVENYLEGFHIPFVHSSLNDTIDYGSYTTELFAYSSLQLTFAKPGGQCFKMNEISPDFGNEVAAFYWWIFPNIMLNYYPWGLSVNIVKPLAKDLTKVSFITYISDYSALDKGAGSGLDRVEREDEAVVETVQKGIQSRFYSSGRYSPKREQGVHHFHRLLTYFLYEK